MATADFYAVFIRERRIPTRSLRAGAYLDGMRKKSPSDRLPRNAHGEVGCLACAQSTFRWPPDTFRQPIYVAESPTRSRSPGQVSLLIQINAPRLHSAKTRSAWKGAESGSRDSYAIFISQAEFIRVSYARIPTVPSALLQEARHGSRLSRTDRRAGPGHRRFSLALRSRGRPQVNVLYVIAGLASVVLSIYLLAALLKPEWFE